MFSYRFSCCMAYLLSDYAGEKDPDVSCEAYLEEAEWKTLAYYKNNRPDKEVKPPTLWEAILLIAALGGFTGGKGRVPGAQVLWRGLKRLHDMAIMFSILKRIPYHSEINAGTEDLTTDGYG